ncbi:MAG: hypothetical protein WA755_11445 [Candidatus Acidiferrales bacterium]
MVGMSAAQAEPASAPRGPGNAALFAAIAGLRWRLLLNSLRTIRGRLELISRVIIGFSLGMLAFGGSIALGVLGYFAVQNEKPVYLVGVFWLIFLFWQLYPVMGSMMAESFDFGSLLRFPVRFSSFYLLSLAYGFFDPVSLICSLWLTGLLLGIAIAHFALAVWALPVFALFALMNVLLSRVVYTWLERWLAQRKTRELFGILFFIVIIGIQFIGPLMQRWGRHRFASPNQFDGLLSASRIFPAGLASNALLNAQSGQVVAALVAFIGLAAYAAAFAALLSMRLRAQFLGENLGESLAPVRVQGRQAVRPAWELRGLSGPVAAIFEKEVRYLSRSGPILFTFVMPLVILVLFRVLPGRNGEGPSFLQRAPDWAFPVGAAYALLMLTNIMYNTFGADGGGFQCFLTAPVTFRDVLFAKNLTHAVILGLETASVLLVTILLYGPPSPSVIFATIAALLFALPLTLAAGNMMSVYSPKKYDYAVFGRQRATGATAFVSIGVQAAVMGVAGLVIVMAHLTGRLWLAGVIFLPLAVASFFVYRTLLNLGARRAYERREILVAEICRT